MYYLFNDISSIKKRKILSQINLITKTYKKGEVIFKEGDNCTSLCLIKKGKIIAKNLFLDGHEIIIRTLCRHDSFGEGLIFSKNPKYRATFIATENVELQLLSKDDLTKLMSSNPQISLNIFEYLNKQSFINMSHIKLLSLKKVSSKVASFFYLKFNEEGKEFQLSLNKTEIAQYLNIERPTFSKELNYLIKNNIISYFHKTYKVLDPIELQKRI
jgi:CRP-like cAMP-binding protein